MRMNLAASVAIAFATLVASTATPPSALTVLAQANTGQTGQTAPAIQAPTAKIKPMAPTGPKVGGVKGTGGTVAELSTQDCKNVGGTVVGVADDRCGASRQYCRMPDTNAVCIDKAN